MGNLEVSMKSLCVIALMLVSTFSHANYQRVEHGQVVEVITDLTKPPVCGTHCLSFKSITVPSQPAHGSDIECDDVDDVDAITDEDSALDGDGGCTIIHSQTQISN